MRVSDLHTEPLIVMRSGYLMHRFIHRLLQDQLPGFSYSTDGAEMGKLMVAEGLGITVLPDFSVIGDPLEQRGVITWRPIADDRTRSIWSSSGSGRSARHAPSGICTRSSSSAPASFPAATGSPRPPPADRRTHPKIGRVIRTCRAGVSAGR